MKKHHTGGRIPIGAEKTLMTSLWHLANQETNQQISDRFGLTESSSLYCIRRVVQWLCSMHIFIRWPIGERLNEVTNGFKDLNGLPDCIGATSVSIIPQNTRNWDYVNRKSYHSINMQAVVDNKSCFTNVYCGEPGSLHDARVLRKSPLFKKCERTQENYSLTTYLGIRLIHASHSLSLHFEIMGISQGRNLLSMFKNCCVHVSRLNMHLEYWNGYKWSKWVSEWVKRV